MRPGLTIAGIGSVSVWNPVLLTRHGSCGTRGAGQFFEHGDQFLKGHVQVNPIRKRRLRAGRHLSDISRSGEVVLVFVEDGSHRPVHNPHDQVLTVLLNGPLRLLVQRVEQLEEVVPSLVRPGRLDVDGLQG